MKEHLESNVIEMDTVHGSNRVGKVMLTLMLRNCNLMPDCTKECVKSVFDRFEGALGLEIFRNIYYDSSLT
ncbi:MAG: hypothetical protein ACYDG2_17355 [Ruminiclostridium sp.]